MSNCLYCSKEIDADSRYCPDCLDKLVNYEPRSCYKPIDLANSEQVCFERQNTYNEVKRAIKAKEESGFFQGRPDRVKQAEKWLKKYEHLKGQYGTDYQKVRHPLDD